jgi:hypothetical protein
MENVMTTSESPSADNISGPEVTYGVTLGIREIIDIVGGVIFLASLVGAVEVLFGIPIDSTVKYAVAAAGGAAGYFLAWKRQRGI